MKAVVKTDYGPNKIEIKDVEVPKIGFGEVLVKVHGCSICNTEVRYWRGTEKDDPLLQRMLHVPVILGNENYGEVADTGPGVNKWKVGDRVVSEVCAGVCGHCMYCRTGYPQLCAEIKWLGRAIDGAFAEYFKVGAQWLHKIPDSVSDDDAALTEMSAVVMQNLSEISKVQAGDVVVIIGPGPIGQMASQVAKALGARIVMVLGIEGDEKRLKMASDLGADITINQDEKDPYPVILELTEGRGADIVVEACGFPSAVEQALDLVRKGGKIAQIGSGKRERISITWDKIFMNNITVYGTNAHGWNAWQKSLDLMSVGKIKGAPLLTHKFLLEDWQKGFEIAENKTGIKVALVPELH